MNQFNEMVQALREFQVIATPEAVKEEPEAAAMMLKSMTELFIAATAVIVAVPSEDLPKEEMAKFMETALMMIINMHSLSALN